MQLASAATGEQRAGVVAALLIAIGPGFIRYSAVLHPLTFDVAFFVAAARAIVRRRWVAAAALIGLGARTTAGRASRRRISDSPLRHRLCE